MAIHLIDYIVHAHTCANSSTSLCYCSVLLCHSTPILTSREFNHRVKSISASTFTPEEVAALQKGGNAVAKKIWLATWSWREYPEPDAHEVDELKQFMRAKYVKKLWYHDPNSVEAQPSGINPNPAAVASGPPPPTLSAPSTPSSIPERVRTVGKSQSIDNLAMATPERNLSRKSSTISSDSGSTTMSKVTDHSSNSNGTSAGQRLALSASTSHHQYPSSPASPRFNQQQQQQQLKRQPSTAFEDFMGQMNNNNISSTGNGQSAGITGSSVFGGPGVAFTQTPSADIADPFSLMNNAFNNMNVSTPQQQQQQQPQQHNTSQAGLSMSSNDFFAAFSTPTVTSPVPAANGLATPDPFSPSSSSQNLSTPYQAHSQQYQGQLTPSINYNNQSLSDTLPTTPVGSKSFDDYLSILGQGKPQQQQQQQQQHHSLSTQDAFSTMTHGSIYNTPPPPVSASSYNSAIAPVSLSPQPTGTLSNPFSQLASGPSPSTLLPGGGLQRAYTSDYPSSVSTSPFGIINNSASLSGTLSPSKQTDSSSSSSSNPFATFAKQQPTTPSQVQHHNNSLLVGGSNALSDPFSNLGRSLQGASPSQQNYFSSGSYSSATPTTMSSTGSQLSSLNTLPNPFGLASTGGSLSPMVNSSSNNNNSSQHLNPLQQPAFVRSMSDSNFGLTSATSGSTSSYLYSQEGGQNNFYETAFLSPSRSMTIPASAASNNNNTALNDMFGQWMQPSTKSPSTKYPLIDDLDPFSTSAATVPPSSTAYSNPFSL
ncbi:ArfGAP with FG repeats 1 [Podila epigama]|nr:ArfGAP with FG repeats 1 [Podila epigama]